MRTIMVAIVTFFIATSAFATGENIQKKISKHDIEVMCDFNEYSGAWNQSTGPIVRDYLDPLVTAPNWVERANTNLSKLRGLYLKMTVSLLMFESDSLQKIYTPFVANYKAKLDALTALHIAVATADVDGEAKAQIALNAAGKEGQRFAREFLKSLRDHIDPEELRRIFRERADAAARAIEPEGKK